MLDRRSGRRARGAAWVAAAQGPPTAASADPGMAAVLPA
jgi:hypothetical protein